MKYYSKEARVFQSSLGMLQVGDVLLCTGKSKKEYDPAGKKVSGVTGSKYVHAALYIGNDEILESVMINGIQKKKIDDFLKKYHHCVVLRRSEAWVQERSSLLKKYIDQLISNSTKYNYCGALRLGYSLATNEKDKKNIEKLLKLCPEEKESGGGMFCSQLVASCFIVTGFVGENAVEYFEPSNTVPIKLAQDRAYGDFLGYIWFDENYQVPEDDELYHCMH